MPNRLDRYNQGARQSRILDSTGRRFIYEAADDSKHRRKPTFTRLQSEDWELLPVQRAKIISALRDLPRNFSVAAWMIRKHLDYVATHTFACRVPDKGLKKAVEAFVEWWSRAENCDVAGRHSLQKMIRLGEGRALTDGDVFFGKLSSGKLAGVEGDRVRTPIGGGQELPQGVSYMDLVHGVWLGPNGRAKGFCLHDRGPWANNFIFKRLVPAMFMRQHGFFDRFDQVRGISPIVPAINSLRDLYEGFEHGLARMKISQLFALAIYRDEAEPPAEPDQANDTDDGNADADPTMIDFGKGPQVLDMNQTDKAEFLESKQPSLEFQQYSTMMLGVTMKSLDIPLCFYDESVGNWPGQRQANILYEQSAVPKRKNVEATLDDLTTWRVGLAVLNDELFLPSTMTVDELMQQCEWIPTGMPWLNPRDEVLSDMMSIASGINSRERVCRRRFGVGAEEIEDEQVIENARRKAKGLSTEIVIPQLPTAPIEETAK